MAIRPLNRVPIPVIGENIYGYIRRFASCLGYERTDAFRHAVAIRDFGPTSDPWRWERLAALAGFPVESLLHMRWRDPTKDTDRGVVTFLGHQLRATHLSFARMRFCPTCLQADGAPEQRVLRDHWALFMAPVCARHGTLLVDACDECGDAFTFRRKTGVWSCGCGRNMIDVPTSPASDAAMGITMALQSCFGPTRFTGYVLLGKQGILPDVFRAMPLNDLASVVDRIGIIAATPADEDEPVEGDRLSYKTGRIDQDRTIAECARQIEHAYPILRDWPAGFERLISDVAGRNPAPTGEHRVRKLFATRMGRLLLDPVRGVDGKPIGVLDEVIRGWLHREHGYRWGQRKDFPKWGTKEEKLARAAMDKPQRIAAVKTSRLENRVYKLIRNNVFMNRSDLNALIATLWANAVPIDPLVEPGIQTRRETRTYGRRTFPRNMHSVRDGLRIMQQRYGASPDLAEPIGFETQT